MPQLVLDRKDGTKVYQDATWRQIAAPIIQQVLMNTEGLPEDVVRRELREAYPFGQRENWPYKVWLDEIRRQRCKSYKPDPKQPELF